MLWRQFNKLNGWFHDGEDRSLQKSFFLHLPPPTPTPQTRVFMKHKPHSRWEPCWGWRKASRRWLIHCIWPLVVGSGKWTGKVWRLFSRDMMWTSSLSWRSRGCVVVADYLFHEWKDSGSAEDDMGHVVCITIALGSGGRSLWSPCQWVPWSLGERHMRCPTPMDVS